MQHFFVKPSDIEKNKITIFGNDAFHITKVLRLHKGNKLTVSDGYNLYEVEILRESVKQVKCNILKRVEPKHDKIKLILMQCLPKSAKMDMIIQKGTELGVNCFIPLKCKRSIVKLEDKKAAKLKRWQKIAFEASKQSRRIKVPEISHPVSFIEALNKIPPDALFLMPWEGETTTSLKDVLGSVRNPKEVYIAIGPEGGFDEEEVSFAREHGARIVSLGSRIMRTETAGLYVSSVVIYLFSD